VVYGHVGLHSVLKEGIDEAVVVVNALLVDRAYAVGHDAVPRDGEAVVFEAERPHELHVLRIEVVHIISDIARVPMSDAARNVRVCVPGAEALASLEPGALNLVAVYIMTSNIIN
jgi:hypothetical protein